VVRGAMFFTLGSHTRVGAPCLAAGMMQAEDTVPLQHVSDTLLSAFRRAAFRRIEGGSFQVRGARGWR
jgi:hypothetical protein